MTQKSEQAGFCDAVAEPSPTDRTAKKKIRGSSAPQTSLGMTRKKF